MVFLCVAVYVNIYDNRKGHDKFWLTFFNVAADAVESPHYGIMLNMISHSLPLCGSRLSH